MLIEPFDKGTIFRDGALGWAICSHLEHSGRYASFTIHLLCRSTGRCPSGGRRWDSLVSAQVLHSPSTRAQLSRKFARTGCFLTRLFQSFDRGPTLRKVRWDRLFLQYLFNLSAGKQTSGRNAGTACLFLVQASAVLQGTNSQEGTLGRAALVVSHVSICCDLLMLASGSTLSKR